MAPNLGSWFENAAHDAVDDRRVLEGIMRQGGVGSDTDCVATPGAGLVINISAGHVFIPGSVAAGPGWYHGYNDGAEPVAISAPSVSARTDLIVAIVNDSFYSGGSDEWTFEAVAGSTGSFPNPPATPNNAIPLYELTVNPGDTGFASGDLTRVATRYSPRGAVIPCLSTARPSSPSSGETIYETNTKNTKQWHNSTIGWERIWNVAWGEISTDAIGTNETGVTTTVTEISNLSVATPSTFPAGRTLMLRWGLAVAADVANEGVRLYAREGGDTLETWEIAGLPGFGVYTFASGFTRINNPSSGVHTYKMHFRRSNGSNDVHAGAGSDANGLGRLWLEDVGPA